ncbi:RhaT Permeases of the drug/metabolite transporter (DMT) superfamily [actinobacterium SCGC AAA044-D11]
MKQHDHTAIPAAKDLGLLSLGVIGVGTSGPVIAASVMPVPSLIFWRNLGGAAMMLPFALRNKEWKTQSQREALTLSSAAGFLLAMHFICFFFAMRLTSVAAGTALAALQPIFTAFYFKLRGGIIPKRAWGGMFIAFLSVLLITGVDFQISLRNFAGDLLALLGAALAAGYMLIGSKAQQKLSTSTYTTACYFTCAVTTLVIAIATGSQYLHFEARQWWLVVALILGAQFLGHTMFNMALRRVSPVIVALIVFFEVPVSAIIAFFWLDQVPPAGIIPGIIGLLIGCGIFVSRAKVSPEND